MDQNEDSNRLKAAAQGVGRCRLCKMTDHWSRNCPYKDLIGDDELDNDAGGPGDDRRFFIISLFKTSKSQ